MTFNGGTPAVDLWAQVEQEYGCRHVVTAFRRRRNSNDTVALVRQCARCGWTTPNIAHAQYAGVVRDLPDMDKELSARWSEARRARYVALASAQREVWRAEYAAYRHTPEWTARRLLVMERADYWCEGCRRARATEVHHLTYGRVGRELLFDLVAVCRACHQWATESQGQGR